MSCDTLWLLSRGDDCRINRLDGRAWHFPSARDALLALENTSVYREPYSFVGCRGFAIDAVARRARFHDCKLGLTPISVVESLERSLAAAPGWADWEIEYARGGLVDLVEVVPGARSLLAAHPERAIPLTLCTRDAWLLDWNAGAHELTYRRWNVPYRYQSLLTIVRDDLRVFDYALDDDLPVGLGPSLLAALEPEPPFPLPYELDVDQGAVIDVPRRVIRVWSSRAPLATFAAVWPGWRVERLPYGYAGHLAATGRTAAFEGDSRLHDDDDLRARGASDAWLEGRRALAIDGRPLRPPRECPRE
jgi:hypothetical protein